MNCVTVDWTVRMEKKFVDMLFFLNDPEPTDIYTNLNTLSLHERSSDLRDPDHLPADHPAPTFCANSVRDHHKAERKAERRDHRSHSSLFAGTPRTCFFFRCLRCGRLKFFFELFADLLLQFLFQFFADLFV